MATEVQRLRRQLRSGIAYTTRVELLYQFETAVRNEAWNDALRWAGVVVEIVGRDTTEKSPSSVAEYMASGQALEDFDRDTAKEAGDES